MNYSSSGPSIIAPVCASGKYRRYSGNRRSLSTLPLLLVNPICVPGDFTDAWRATGATQPALQKDHTTTTYNSMSTSMAEVHNDNSILLQHKWHSNDIGSSSVKESPSNRNISVEKCYVTYRRTGQQQHRGSV